MIPECARLPDHAREDFLFRQIQTGRTIRLGAETARGLQRLKEHRTVLGIASNAQGYTLRELNDALAGYGSALDLFDRDLCFWSFEHGFSKPDPHVFQMLTARLAARGINPERRSWWATASTTISHPPAPTGGRHGRCQPAPARIPPKVGRPCKSNSFHEPRVPPTFLSASLTVSATETVAVESRGTGSWPLSSSARNRPLPRIGGRQETAFALRRRRVRLAGAKRAPRSSERYQARRRR